MKPMHGAYIYKALKDKGCIIMACNTRICVGIMNGLFRAAKESDSALVIELAKSECNSNGGYTGLTPAKLSEHASKAASKTEFDVWALHADHTAVKKGTDEELVEVKKLLTTCIDADYSSFAIDASHLFNFEGNGVEEELGDNIRSTIVCGQHIKQQYQEKHGNSEFGFEAEVGEIGRKDTEGMILTTPEEAEGYIKALNNAEIFPQILAIANGSTHGNIYDENGKMIEQINIDVQQTKEVAQALRDMNSEVRIAQHGITGTPLHLIKEKFPHGDIIKGNVGTFWQNLFWDIIKEEKPEFFNEVFKWVIETYSEKAKEKGAKSDDEIWGKFGKFATKQFFDKIYALDIEVVKKIEEKTYEEALKFFDAFKANGSAQIVRDYIKTINN
ncbi:class II fructose-bisphosphate aldolase [Candidatus Woesearchaeota archaeon]|nr:class II fructose-bisphosphate aldolase [Candidatus Woesearchaeota archaeon]